MNNIRAFLPNVRSFLLAIILALTSLSVGGNFVIRKDPDVKLTIALFSDTHVGTELYRRAVFAPGVDDVSHFVKPDIFLVAGDCTDNGNEENWQAFSAILQKRLRVDATVLALGNHDSWVSYDDDHPYAEARANFIKYSNALMGTQNEEVYSARKISGYWFLVLGSEDSTTDAVFSQTQLDWLSAALQTAAADEAGKPIFVINHQPMNFTHAVGADEEASGFESQETSDALRALLNTYENVFYISGHQHKPLALADAEHPDAFATVERVGDHITSINLPCYEYGTFLEGGTAVLGQGLVAYVYADRVQLRGRNFFLHNWDKTFNLTIPLE